MYQTNKFFPREVLKHSGKKGFLGRISRKVFFAFFAVFAAAAVLGLSAPARSLVSDALLPFFKTGDAAYGSAEKAPKFFSEKTKLMEENRALAEELEKTRAQLSDYASIKLENEKLRQELGLKPAGGFEPAAVLARSPQIPLDTLLVDKGARDDVSEGDMVLAGERVLVGKIANFSESRATVALNSFAGAVTYGYVARTEEPIEIKGDGGANIKARVPIDFDVVAGDQIMAHGSAPYLAAIVGMVEDDASSGFKEVFLSLPVNVSKTNFVFIERRARE